LHVTVQLVAPITQDTGSVGAVERRRRETETQASAEGGDKVKVAEVVGRGAVVRNGEDMRVSGVGADERPRAGGLACAEVEPADVVERERELVL